MGDSKYIYKNELDKTCSQPDMAHGDCKNLHRRTIMNIIWRDKVFNIAKSPKYDGYQRGLASVVYTFFDKKTSNTNKGTGINSENKYPKGLAMQTISKRMIRKFEKQKVHSSFIDNI